MNKYFSFAFSLFFAALILAVLSIADRIISFTEIGQYASLISFAALIAGFIFAIIGFRRADR